MLYLRGARQSRRGVLVTETSRKDAIVPLCQDFPPPARADWLALVEKTLNSTAFDSRLVSTTDDGLKLQPLYTPDDWPQAGDPSGMPGAAPFTRGVHAMPRPRAAAWDIRTGHDDPDPRRTNRAILDDLEGGVTSIEFKAGRGGISIAEISRALDGVRPDGAAVALDAGVDFAHAGQALIAFWRTTGAKPADIMGALNADPLGALARDGALHRDLNRTLARMAELTHEAADFPRVTAVAVDTRPYHNAGATEAQELAAMLATGVAYVRVLIDEGFSIDDAFGRIAVTLTADADMYLTIAKLRAARLVWSRMAEACGAGEKTQKIRLHVQTSERMMTRFDIHGNMLRTTAATLAASIGGADGITVLPHTHALGLPDGFARRIARNTQIILMEESHLGVVTDPAGGAFAFESLTEDLAQAAWTRFQEIEAEGGMAAVLRSGSFRKRIEKTWTKRQRRIATRRDAIVGVSIYADLDEPEVTAPRRPAAPAPSGGGERIEPLPRRCLAESFEHLRIAGEAAGATAFSINIGRLADYMDSAAFAKTLLEAGGIAVPERGAAELAEAAARAVNEAGARIAVLCSSPDLYAEHAVPYARALKQAGVRWLILAADPGPHEAVSRESGIDAFLFPGCDAVAVLEEAQRALGIGAP